MSQSERQPQLIDCCSWKVIWDYLKDENCVRGDESIFLNHTHTRLRLMLYLFCHDYI
jgi:hypothetical protein